MSFIAISYGSAAIVFLLFALLLLSGWNRRASGVRLIVAVLATAIWAGALAQTGHAQRVFFLGIYIPELLRDAAWLWVLTEVNRDSLPRLLSIGTYILLGALLVVGLLVPALHLSGFNVDAPSRLLSRAGLLLSFVGLVLIEQTYRNAGAGKQRSLRFFVLGVGGMFAYDLFLYSQSELVGGLSIDAWSARGFVNVVAAPLIAVAVRRNHEWDFDIFVSRHVTFYTAAFMAVGAYMLLMAVGGYYVRSVGGTWGGIAQIFFLAGAVIMLLSMVFSMPLRRRLKVFISKHFYRNKYDYRLEWLRFIQTLSSMDDGNVRRTALRAVVEIVHSPGGVLFTIDESRRRFVSAASWPNGIDTFRDLQDVSPDEELLVFLAERQWIIDLREYRATPEVYQNLCLPTWIAARSDIRIIAPMLELNRLVGFFILLEPPPPFALTYEDRDLLKTVGRHVATHVAQFDANNKLAESRQFETYSRLTAFLMHDLKNAVAQLSLLVANAERHKNNPEFIEDAFGTIANAAERMTRLIEQLQRGAAEENNRRVSLNAIVERAVNRCAIRQPIPTLTSAHQELKVVADADRLSLVLEHVIRNAQEATNHHGEVRVKVQLENGGARISVEDSGAGMDADFVRERLFRPFDSTKGSRGMGIGAYQAREYARSLGGDVEVTSVLGAGTCFTIALPVAADADIVTT